MTGFALFRLPFLPLKGVVDYMSPCDLVMLYLSNEKFLNVMKLTKKSVSFDLLSFEEKEKLNIMERMYLLKLKFQKNPDGPLGCCPNDKANLTVTISNILEIQIDCPLGYKNMFYGCFPLSIEILPIDGIPVFGTESKLKIAGIFVPVKMMDKRRILTFWEKPDNGFKTFINYFKNNFFNTKINECCIKGSTDPKFSKNLRAAVQEIGQETIDSCEIKYDINSEDYKFILDNIKPTICFKHLNYSGRLTANFQHKTNFTSKYFHLDPANWFTFDNLITTDCERIYLENSILTNDDIYKYLKLWMDGKFQKLRKLTVQPLEKVNLSYIFSKLQSYSQIYTLVQKSDSIFIKRQNETVATIEYINGTVFKNKFLFTVHYN